jgi:hypothetical protein
VKPRITTFIFLLNVFTSVGLAHAQPTCFSGPTRSDNFYQNYTVDNRCGGTVRIQMSIERDGKVDHSVWSVSACSHASKQGEKSWKYNFEGFEWDASADSKTCTGDHPKQDTEQEPRESNQPQQVITPVVPRENPASTPNSRTEARISAPSVRFTRTGEIRQTCDAPCPWNGERRPINQTDSISLAFQMSGNQIRILQNNIGITCGLNDPETSDWIAGFSARCSFSRAGDIIKLSADYTGENGRNHIHRDIQISMRQGSCSLSMRMTTSRLFTATTPNGFDVVVHENSAGSGSGSCLME